MSAERQVSAAPRVAVPTLRRPPRTLVSVALAMAVFAAAVATFANAFWLSATTSAIALSLSVAGVAVLYGQLGLVSLCQFALVGVGGWVTLRIGHAFHPPFEASRMTCPGPGNR